MSTVNKIKYNLYKWSAILGAIAMVVFVAYLAFRTLPYAKKTIGVYAHADYEASTKGAMKVWNDQVGCTFLIPGKDIYVQPEGGMPCGDAWRPKEEWGHAATAYRCTEQQPSGHWTEILIAHPGNLWTQTWTIGHEIGHKIGAKHNSYGIMAPTPDPNSDKMPLIPISDADIKTFNKEFCK